MSPGSLRLKKDLKVPLVLILWGCGLIYGSSIVFLKVFGEIINSPDFLKNIFFASIVGGCGIAAAGLQIYMLNLSMKLYNNLDVMPIYQSMILMHMMLAGLILLDESALYTWGELCALFGSAIFVILGIYILTQKQSFVLLMD